MSLFGTINNSVSALQTAQIGLQTVGSNIANANTDGYIRQELVQTTPEPYRRGNIILGHGVRASAVVQQVDKNLLERLWEAGSDLSAANVRSKTLAEIEQLLNDLNDGGLSDDLNSLNSALHDLSTQPNDPSLKQFVVLTGESLASELNRTYVTARSYQTTLDQNLSSVVEDVNGLTEKIAKLNLQIMVLEGGRTLSSDATGLRDERYRTLEKLSELIKIKTEEQDTGAVTVFVGGDYLVSETTARQLTISREREENSGQVIFKDTGAAVPIMGGQLKAMTDGRDTLLGGVLEGLDQMAADLIREFNVIHSQGQAKNGFQTLTGTVPLIPSERLDQAGFPWTVEGGSFEISMVDENGDHVSRTRIDIRKGNPLTSSSPQSVVADMDAIDGISARLLASGEIQIDSDVPGLRFTFGSDTTGFVAAAGLNTFFTGTGAETIGLNSVLTADPNMLAISSGGIGKDTNTLTQLVDLIDSPITRNNGKSIRDGYGKLITDLAQSAANQQAATEGLSQYYGTLQGQHLAISGVNIDEEAIKMIAYQRAFQASSRVIAAANEMLEILTSL
jgi:flagellar hook-associated protein 1 FlgK